MSEKIKFENFHAEFTPEQEEEINKVKLLRKELFDKFKFDAYNAIAKFNKQIKEKYPDYIKCYLYHVLIGSSIETDTLDFDFPGEDSVLDILKSIKEYLELEFPEKEEPENKNKDEDKNNN